MPTTRADDDLRRKVISRISEIEMNSQDYRQSWRDIIKYVANTRAKLETGDAFRNEPNYDITAPVSVDITTAYLWAATTPTNQHFFGFDVDENTKYLLKQGGKLELVKAQLQANTAVTYDYVNKSTFFSNRHQCNLDLLQFGNSLSFIGERKDRVMPFFIKHINIGDSFVGIDAEGAFSEQGHYFYLFGKEVLAYFSDLDAEKTKLLEEKPNEKFKFAYMVAKKNKWDYTKDVTGKTWVSFYVGVDLDICYLDNSYNENPYVFERYAVAGDSIYGYSPTYTALPSIIYLNKLLYAILQGSELLIKPPLIVKFGSLITEPQAYPNGITYEQPTLYNENSVRQLYQSFPNIPVGIDLIRHISDNIVKVYYSDILKLKNGPEMTATEVVRRDEDTNNIIAPNIARIQSEGVNPQLMRIYNILARQGIINDVSKQVGGKDKIGIKIISPYTISQNYPQIKAAEYIVKMASNFVAMTKDTTPLKTLNLDEMIRSIGDKINLDQTMLRSKAEVDKLVAAEQQQQALASAQQQNVQGSEMYKNMATAASQQAQADAPPPEEGAENVEKA